MLNPGRFKQPRCFKISEECDELRLLDHLQWNMILLTALLCLCILISYGVFGVEADVMKSVMEGDSVTLRTDVTEIKTDEEIRWVFVPLGIGIAQLYNNISTYDSNGRFKDRLQLNSQTGSLTIRNITITDSGLYKLQISNNSKKEPSYKRFTVTFNVTVYAHLPSPVITRDSSQCSSSSERSSSSNCSLLCSVMNVTQVTLSWYKGNCLLSSISVSDLNTSLPLEVEYQDTNTYSCVVNNPITNQTKHLNITDLCVCSDQHSYLTVLMSVFVVLLIVAVAAGVMYSHRNKCRQAKHDDLPFDTRSRESVSDGTESHV